MRKDSRSITPRHADIARATVPVGHPLEMWEIEEAAKRVRLGVETLRASECPRAKIGTRVLFDPIETIAWARLYLSHVITPPPHTARDEIAR